MSTRSDLADDRTVLDALDIIESRDVASDVYETCASAKAKYDDVRSELEITVDAFVRRFEMRGKDVQFRPAWLPRKDTVRMHSKEDEAAEAAKEVFRSWVKRVRGAIPPFSEWKPGAVWLPHR